MSKRGETWTDKEVRALISIWSREEIMKMLSNTHKNADIYNKMSTEMSVLGYQRDYLQCRTKVKHLKAEYKKYKDALGRSGADRGKPPKYFDEMDIFLGDQPEATGVSQAIDTSSSSNKGLTSKKGHEKEDLEMVAKYGEGKIQEKICPNCEYKSEIQTAGVHLLGSGCIKVYTDDDEFQCPRCGFTEEDDDDQQEEPSAPAQLSENKNKNAKTATGEGKKANNQRKRKLSKQAGYENVVADFTSYQKEADDKFLKLIEQQGKEDVDLRKLELQAYTDSMALLARAIAGHNTAHHQQFVYDQETSQTLYRL